MLLQRPLHVFAHPWRSVVAPRDARFHLVDPVLAHITPIEEEGYLGGDRLLRFTQALPAQAAGLAILLRPLEFYHPVAVDRAFAAIAVELLTG